MKRGDRKFTAFILMLIAFVIIALIRNTSSFLDLASAITLIGGAYIAGNVVNATAYMKTQKLNENKNEEK